MSNGRGDWHGYYFTAYGIAVKHGFTGTEEEWLESLRGKDGPGVEVRYDQDQERLEWKREDQEAWAPLLDINGLRGQVVGQTLAAASQARDKALEAQAGAESARTGAQAAQQLAQGSAEAARGRAEAAETSAVQAGAAQASAEQSAVRAESASQGAVQAQGAAEAAKTAAEDARDTAQDAADQTEDAAQAVFLAKNEAQTAHQGALSNRLLAQSAAGEASASASRAAESAEIAREHGETALQQSADALVAAGNAETDAAAVRESVNSLGQQLTGMGEDLAGKVDGAYVENGYLYLTSGDEVAAGPLGPFSGSGGGGGGSASYTMTLKNLLPSRILTVSNEGPVELSFQYASADEDGNDDGPGVGTLTVNGMKAATLSVPQGNGSIDISQYLVSGSNTVRLRVENSEGTARTLSYTVTVVALTMSTTFDAMGIYNGAVIFSYTVAGTGTKTVHFLMDGVEIGTEEVASSGRSRSYALPAQADGAHVLTAYAQVTVSGTAVRSNTLTVGMLYASGTMTDCAVLSPFTAAQAVQGDILRIPYLVYDPQNEEAAVTLSVLNPDRSVYSTQALTVDRTAQEWAVQNYPVGAVKFRISCGTATAEHAVEVAESAVVIEPVTDGLALCFDPTGRSNLEAQPAAWTDGTVSASFTGVSFSGADGWLTDPDGAAILRLLPGGGMTIPFQLFAADARASGATIEVEMATHNVRDYDTVVISCLSGGRGFRIASQYAQISSEQSQLSMQFKEDEKVRVSFVIEPRNLHRLIYVFVDGVLCGAIQYPENDNFAQNPAAGITIGADSSGIDLYRIRLYAKGLTRGEVLDNYIADRALLSQRTDAALRNDIFDLADSIVISKLPATLPYMVISCPELPQYKGDKKTCQIEYVNPADTSRSFTADGVQINVQGTSSAGYKKKNFKFTLKSGLTYTAGGEAAEDYLLRPGSIPAKTFCMKADVASSEGANNVELVRLYNDTVPHKTPPQQEDPRVRVGIDGVPCVVFWHDTGTGETRFWGKYNFNFDKGAEAVFGLAPGCESWEIKNNTSDRVVFKSADFTGDGWKDDFEARYPEESTDCSNLAAMCAWVVSTDRDAVTSEADKAARLQKFKDEFEDHFVKAPTLFYYLFTEVFLMVDSRAKNFFPTTFDGVHWLPFPYDFDTAVGINNEGQLVFDYDLEDSDTVGGDKVFNGQDSVLWRNVRDAFGDELRTMYQTLRSGSAFNYAEVVRRYAEHQAVWPEAVWNEDAWEKYLEPLEHDNDSSYLTMLQGSKASQREWWLYNGFRYRDSKYQCGDAQSSFITLRCYSVGDVTVTPYSHVWPRVKYGSYTVTQRGKRNVPLTLECPLDAMNDTEVYIYSADRLAAIGDLSGLQVGYANFSMAGKLQSLKLGDGADTYQNTRLTELYVGNNELLTSLDVRNCANLAQTVDLSGCVGVETVRAGGSAVTGFALPVGGRLKTLELPGTVTNLTLRELARFETLTMTGYDSLTTLWVDGTPNVPLADILAGAESLDRARLIGVEITLAGEEALGQLIAKLKGCSGLDAAGNNTDRAVVTGRVSVPSVSAELLAEISDAFPQLVVVAGGQPQYVVRYLDWDNTLLYRAVVSEGADAVNPVIAGLIQAPTRPDVEGTGWDFLDFGDLPTDIHGNVSVVARYEQVTRTYTVRFYNGSTLLQTVTGVAYGGSASYTGSTPEDPGGGEFDGWSPPPYNIAGDTDCYAQYQYIIPEETITDSWEEIFAAIADGTYATKYSIGDTKVLHLGSEGYVDMQIAAFDADDLADGSGKAPITWISKHLLRTDRRMNPPLVGSAGNYTEGTGGIGGWEKCEMRSYLEDTIRPLIPDVVRNAIQPVIKTQRAVNAAGKFFDQTTTDLVWLPDYIEMFGGKYRALFPDNESRVKTKVEDDPLNKVYSLRYVYKTNAFYAVGASGQLYEYSKGEYAEGVVIGFCT